MECYIRLLKYRRRFYKKQKALGFIPDIRSTDETLDKILRSIVLSVDLGMESSIFYVRKGMDFALLINPWPKDYKKC